MAAGAVELSRAMSYCTAFSHTNNTVFIIPGCFLALYPSWVPS